ncbi:Mediator complex subunit Med31 protein [Dioscorea alata]|uniref:Mediator complex subunit Med31 protein n=1 Tax=Dioscorea alata TaxID=55571 RepID=A0ACB7VHY9_DIOAL|nr:Mediator complex subunit Med31 protein [Dioscorea alata]
MSDGKDGSSSSHSQLSIRCFHELLDSIIADVASECHRVAQLGLDRGLDEEEEELRLSEEAGTKSPIKDLAQNRYFVDEAFIGYLKYLQYWQKPEYVKYIMYPHCLFFLELLQNANFQNAMAHPGNKRRLISERWNAS